MKSFFICKCTCGGNVRGVKDFGRVFSWCTKCTPVVKVNLRRKPKQKSQGTT